MSHLSPDTYRGPRTIVPSSWSAAGTVGVLSALLAGLLFGLTEVSPALALLVGGVGLCVFGYLALFRFEFFVLAVLVTRSALDSPHLSGASEASLSQASSSTKPAAALAVGFLLVALVWFGLNTRRNSLPPAPLTSVRMPALLLVSAGFVSVISSTAPRASLIEAVRVAGAIAMLLVLERLLVDRSSVQRLLVAVYASALVPLFVATVQLVTGGGRLIGGFSRIQGTFDHPNPFAIYLTFLVVVGAGLFRHLEGRWRWALFGVLAASWVFLLLTYTRSAWISALVGVLVVGILQSRRLVAGVMIAVVAAAILIPSISSRFSDLGQTQYSGAAGNSLSWRFTYWGDLLPLAHRSPLTGVGLKVIQLQATDAKNAHDDFLRSFVEMGLFGLLAYLALLVSLVLLAIRAVRSTTSGLERGVAVGFAGAVAAFLLLSTVSNILSQNVLLWYFFAFTAATAAVVPSSRGDADDTRDTDTDTDTDTGVLR